MFVKSAIEGIYKFINLWYATILPTIKRIVKLLRRTEKSMVFMNVDSLFIFCKSSLVDCH